MHTSVIDPEGAIRITLTNGNPDLAAVDYAMFLATVGKAYDKYLASDFDVPFFILEINGRPMTYGRGETLNDVIKRFRETSEVVEVKRSTSIIELPCDWLRVEECARILRCSVSYVRAIMGQRGCGPIRLASFKHGKYRYALRQAVEDYRAWAATFTRRRY